jgi:diadenosine tetraphosphate (Ap4A) HIT family hydrolase
VPGYSVVVFRGRHVPDPTLLGPDETLAFWSAVAVATRAIEEVFRPCHFNYQILGNAMPHVHVHIVPRYLNDRAPGRFLSDDIWGSASQVPAAVLRDQVAALVQATQGDR